MKYAPKLTPEQIAFVKANWNKGMSGPDIADEIGIDYRKLQKRIEYLRRTGHEIAMPQRLQIGEVTVQRMGRKIVHLEKTSAGLKWLKSEQRSSFKINKPKHQPMPPRNNSRKISAPKPQPIKRTGLTTAEKLERGYQWVQVDAKTKVLRHPDKLTA